MLAPANPLLPLLLLFIFLGAARGLTLSTCTDQALRQALAAVSDGDTITFNCYGTIALTAPLTPKAAMGFIIDGGNKVILDGGGRRAFEIANSNVVLIIKNLIIENCHGSGTAAASAGGGAILLSSPAVLTLDGVTLRNNSSPGTGGAVSAGTSSGPITVTGCRFLYNEAGDHGSAIWGGWHTNITVSGSTFAYNRVLPTATDRGGVIMIHSAVLRVTNSLFAFNSAPEFGVIYNLISNSYVTGCSFWGNFAGGGSVLSVDGGNAVLGPQGVIDWRDSIIAENTGNRRSSAVLLCLYGNGSHPETPSVSDDAYFRNVSFCRNRFTGAVGSPSWGQGAIDSQCNGNNVTHFIDSHWSGNRGTMGDSDILAGSLSIEGTPPLIWDKDSATVFPTASTDGLARACDGVANLNATLAQAIVVPLLTPPPSTTSTTTAAPTTTAGATTTAVPTTTSAPTTSVASTTPIPTTTTPEASSSTPVATTSAPAATLTSPSPTKPTAPPSSQPGSISLPLNECLSETQTLQLRQAIDGYLHITGTTLVVLCNSGPPSAAVILPAGSADSQLLLSAVATNNFQTSTAAKLCTLNGCGVSPFGVTQPATSSPPPQSTTVSTTAVPTTPSPSRTTPPATTTKPKKKPPLILIAAIVGGVLLLALLILAIVIVVCCCMGNKDERRSAASVSNWGPGMHTMERYARELYPVEHNGYSASPLHTPAQHPSPLDIDTKPFMNYHNQAAAARTTMATARPPLSAPPPTMIPERKPTEPPAPPPRSPPQGSTVQTPSCGTAKGQPTIRVRPPPNTMRACDDDTQDDSSEFAPTVRSVAEATTIQPPPKPMRPPPAPQSVWAPAPPSVLPLSSLNVYADHAEAPPPPPRSLS